MAVEIAPRRTRKPKAASETLAIGEMDQTIFACPACARPLVNGARRCPGCGTRLIIGVQAQRASILIGAGLMAGLLLGGGSVATLSALGGSGDGAAAAATTKPSARTSPGPSGASPAATIDPGTISNVPALSRSALLQTTAVNARLATWTAGLSAALAARKFDTFGMSQMLRAMSADAVIGLQLSIHIGAWSGGKDLSGELNAYYAQIQETAGAGLSAAIRNEKAYRSAGQKMLALLGGLAPLDAHVREVAGQAGVEIPAAGAPAP